ncbi:MAG TPA: hypothetical protein VHB27_08565 [Rhodopila sp.]|uniref:hypothetical protein n=1 Tax=Rhodopila sp. TaxID=2480087 RepID=UPI002C45B6E8|nr:hypothetical protein [Rhodopila sp.]HVY15266.1 hypothetical protein [Rhodopila sp.]
MASAATWVITLAVIAGTLLAFWHLRAAEGIRRPPAWAGMAHGLAGAVGLGLLLLALRGPARGAAEGTGSFGRIAAWLFGGALAVGLAVWARRRRGPMLTVLLHTALAVTGWVVLLAWAVLG